VQRALMVIGAQNEYFPSAPPVSLPAGRLERLQAARELRAPLERHLRRMGVSPGIFISVEPRGELARGPRTRKLRQAVNLCEK